MKIQNEESVINLSSLQKSRQEKEVAGNSQAESGSAGDQVQLSPRAKQFQRIKDVLETLPDQREAKVAELKASIENGTFKADPQKAAENLMNDSIIDVLG